MRKYICFFLSLLAVLAGGRAMAQGDEPLTFGVISDIHFGNTVGEGPMVKVPQALRNLTSQGRLDVLAVVGDLANSGAASEYEQLVGVFQDEANYTNPVDRFLFMMGNHDNFDGKGKSHYQEGLKAFNGGEPYPYHIYTVVKGYPFITISEFSGDSNDTGNPSSGTAAYPKDNVALLESYLERASQECPGKPIFVFTHVPPRWTVWGAWPELENGSAWGMQVLNPVLNKYPQVVVFAGHSHYPLGDPRSIHQGANPQSSRQNYYTVINTASTTYSEVHPNAVDAGIHPAGYDYVTEGLILTELPNGDIEVRRYDTYRNLEIGAGSRWVLKAPFDGSMFQYADIRDADDNPDGRPLRDGGAAPTFGKNPEFVVTLASHKAEVAIPQATDDECVFRYRLRLSKGGLVVAEKFVFSQFYLNTDMPATVTCTFNGLDAGTQYVVEVVAMDSYDKMSAPVNIPFTTPSGSSGQGTAPDARWTFDDPSDLLKGGSDNIVLQPISVGRKSVTVVESTGDVGITAITGKEQGDGAAFVPKNAGFKVVRNNGWVTQDYTILMDIKMDDTYPYNALYQTNVSNSNDGDLFINKRQIGINVNGLGYHGELEDDTWYRILILNRNGDFCVYVNGELVGSTSSLACWELDPWGFYLFCDEDEEMTDTYVSEVAYWEYGLSESEARELSGLLPIAGDPYVNVLTEMVKIADDLDFTVTLDANVPFEFLLPEWIEGIDIVPFAGKRAYSFRAQPMDKTGRRTGYITVQADGVEPQDIEVEQVYVGDDVPEPLGRWTFDDPFDLLKGMGQSVLFAACKGDYGPETTDDLASVGIVPIAGPTEENGAVSVPADAYLWLAANANEEVLTNYTILFDICPADLKGYKALFQNDITNRADAGLFIKDNTIGRGGSSTNIGYVGGFEAERWYRILFVVQDSRAKVYIDGVKIGESPNAQDYWTLLGDCLLFADNDGEEGTVNVADIRLWDFPLSDNLAKKLGDVFSDIEELFIVQTTSVRLVDETDFSITVNANLPVSFDLPDWIEPVDVTPFNGEKAYMFRAQPLDEEGRRSDIISVEAGYLDSQEVVVTQIKLGDCLPEAMGCWTFDDPARLFEGAGDAALYPAVLDDDGVVQSVNEASEAGITVVAGPLAGNGAISIPVDACLWLANNLDAGQLKDFSILYDVRPSAFDGWNGLYQKDSSNKGDCGLFIKNGMVGSGLSGLSYHGSLVPSKWHRILFVVKAGYATVYLDGEKVGQSTSISSSWTMLPDVLLFMDNDGETKANDVAEIRFWDVPLGDGHAKELGAVEQDWEGEPFADPVGVWTFDNATDPLAGIGTATLRGAVKGINGPELVDDLSAAGFEPVEGPAAGNGALTVPLDCYLQLAHNEGGDLNSFSMLMDIRPKSLSGYNALFQSHADNDDDGSLYTKGTQIGINMSGLGYGGELVEGKWHRIVFVVDENRMSVYIDGLKVLATYQPNTDRWVLHEVGWIFTDDNGEEGTVDVAELRFWDVALPVEQVVQLGSTGTDTSVRNITDDSPAVAKGVYDLTGRRINNASLQRGLYIVDGKKVLIR